jgi:hypothetical protein
MQRRYDEFGPRKAGRLRNTLMPWSVILVMIIMLCTVLDASITSEQRTALFQQSGFFP